MARIKMHIPKAKLPFYPPYEVKYRLQNGVSTLGPKCPFFKWVDNPTCMRGNEAAHLVQQNLDLLRSELQLAHEREREATQAVAEATQMAEIAQDRAAKATERERKF